jgi:integrase
MPTMAKKKHQPPDDMSKQRRPWGAIDKRGGSIRVKPRGDKEWVTLPHGSTPADAQAWLDGEKRRRLTGCAYEPSALTVEDFIEKVWLPARAEEGTLPGTLRAYREDLRRLYPLIGSVLFQALTRQQVEQARKKLQEGTCPDSQTGAVPAGTPGKTTQLSSAAWRRGKHRETTATGSAHAKALSPKSINNSLNTLRTALSWAVGHDMLPRNVAESVYVKRLKVPQQEQRVLTADEAKRFLAACREMGPPYGPYLAAGVLTGKRVKSQWGAMLWRDVDLPGRRAYVHRTMDRDGSVRELAAGDYKGGPHWIGLPRLLVPFLESQRAWQHREMDGETDKVMRISAAQDGERLVFTNNLGQRIAASSLRYGMEQVLKLAGIPEWVKLHGLRHSAASLLFSLGAEPKEVQAVLGHSRLSTTMDIYTALMPGRMAATIELLDSLGEAQQA